MRSIKIVVIYALAAGMLPVHARIWRRAKQTLSATQSKVVASFCVGSGSTWLITKQLHAQHNAQDGKESATHKAVGQADVLNPVTHRATPSIVQPLRNSVSWWETPFNRSAKFPLRRVDTVRNVVPIVVPKAEKAAPVCLPKVIMVPDVEREKTLMHCIEVLKGYHKYFTAEVQKFNEHNWDAQQKIRALKQQCTILQWNLKKEKSRAHQLAGSVKAVSLSGAAYRDPRTGFTRNVSFK